jgi:FkbM family methyltransferase
MQWAKEAVKRWLLKRGIALSRPPGQFAIPLIRLAGARDRGLRVNFAIDGGAAEGSWPREFRTVFPDAHILCIEPRDDAQPALNATAAELGNITVAHTLVGATEGVVEFHDSGHRSSILSDESGGSYGKKRQSPMTTLDNLVTRLGLPDPDFIKLDLQGAELQCLSAASRCLSKAEAVLLEVSMIELQQGMPLIGDVVPFMRERGFRVYDIVALWQRPLDGALAQGDFLFVSGKSGLLADKRWSETGLPP